MGIRQPSFLYSPEGGPGGGAGDPAPASSQGLAALTAELGTAAFDVLKESYPSVTRGYESMLAAAKQLTDVDTAGVNFEALESALAQSFSVTPAQLGHALCDFVFHDDEVIHHRDFPQIYRLLLLYVGRLPSRVPGFHYKREAAESFVMSEGSDHEVPFTGFHYLPRTCLLRFDIKGSVQKRLKEGLGMVGTTESHYYALILEVLKEFPAVHYAETAGDETVFLCDDPETTLDFAREVQRRFILGVGTQEGSTLSVEMGITLNGPAYWGITTDGRFMVGGPSYDIAGKVQKLGKMREIDDVGAASGIFVYDCDCPPPSIERTPSLEEYEESIGADSAALSLIDGSLAALSGSAIRMATLPEGDFGVSSISMRRLNGKDPQLVSKLQKILALLASTATDPEGALQDSEVLYPSSTILFLDFAPPISNDCNEPDEFKLQTQWETFMEPIEEIVRRHDGVVLYNSSEGKVIVLMGAFQSSPLRQERRAALCAAELLERFPPEVLRRAVCTQDRLAQGPMAGSLNGAGLGIDFASRLLSVSVKVPGRLVTERNFFKRTLEGSDLLFLGEHVGSYPVRDFGDRELVSFEGAKAPTSDLSSGVEYARLLQAISSHIQNLIRHDAPAVVQSIATQADRGVSPHEFLQVLKENLTRGGATVFSPSEAVQSHRAYGFFKEVLNAVFPSPGHFEQFLARHPGPHEVWRFLFREISSGRISPTLLQNADLVADSLGSLLCAVASDRSLVLELPAWNRLDAFSVPVLETLLRQKATAGHIVFLSAEPLPLDGLPASATIPLSCLDESGLKMVLAAELGVSPDSFSADVIGFYERMIGAAPWVPFLVRSLTRFLVQEEYFGQGKSEFLKSPAALSSANVPGSFEHYTHSLYTGLSPHGKEVFRAAALFGARGEVSILGVLADLDETDFDAAMAELHAVGILHVTGRHYRFLHDFIPQIAPRLFVEAGSTSAIGEKLLVDLCSLADRNPLAVDPHVLMEKASAAGSPERVAPQMAEALGAMVRDLPLDAETLAMRYLASLDGREFSPEQRVAILRVNMHLILAKAQLRRPYDDGFRQLVNASDALRQRLSADLRSTLDAEWGLLLHDAGDVLREKDLARDGAVLLMKIPEGALAQLGFSLRNEIEVAKARIEYRQGATPNALPYDDRVAAAKGALKRVESVLSNSSDLSQGDIQRFRVLSFVIRGFLAVDLLHGTLQNDSPRTLVPEEEHAIDALIVEISDFCDQSGDILALRELMGCTHILSKGYTLRQRFDQAHAVLDDIWKRVEHDGQLGFKVPLMNLKMVAYGEELKQLKANRDAESILRLADTLKPFVEFIEEHRAFLTADESLLFFYLNLIEFNADVFEALPSDHPHRPILLEEARCVLSQRIPEHCTKHIERYRAFFDHAQECFDRMV